MKVVGVDVGGTFTDVFVLDEATGTAQVGKVADNTARSVGRIPDRHPKLRD